MNPFANRWMLLGIVAVFLLAVVELVGTDEQGGLLSNATGASAPAGGEAPPAGVIQVVDPNQTVEAAEPDTPDEDLPQVVMSNDEDVDDAATAPQDGADGGEPDQIDADAVDDQPAEDDSSDE